MYCSWLLFSVGLTSYWQSASELAQFAQTGLTPSHFCFLALQRRQATAVRIRLRTFDLTGLGEVADGSSMVEMRVTSLPTNSGYYMSLPSDVHLGRGRQGVEIAGKEEIEVLRAVATFGRAATIPIKPHGTTSTDRTAKSVIEGR